MVEVVAVKALEVLTADAAEETPILMQAWRALAHKEPAAAVAVKESFHQLGAEAGVGVWPAEVALETHLQAEVAVAAQEI
ncbi:hypothetical protein UFOVP965_16 [uncultured Caudovirales phage]|uniref:Uncharacterized protein n=1 Tax=uncultured Caudovirales phage TaxID=2100421 RepID=A0A6J5Q3B1_9CAUD|nr:hypothetical protein UFOVP965_16 [uncultured Caudovirales phage]CAB4179708.1 hypothetical protein UFOVP1035_12 [uncultured Caudovirales phage]CAB4188827.1 hypothetical protein UFOVP1181_118 [uncultured Caudovirales phage]